VGDAGGIKHANQAALAMLAVRSIEEVSRLLTGPGNDIEVRTATGQPVPRERRPFVRALRGETVREEIVLRSPRTGEDMVLRTVAAPVRRGERVAGAVVVGTDVTSQKRAGQERERLLRQSEQAVADRDHVLAVVSHELRNPLNTVAVAAAVLQETVAVSEPGRKSIASIVRAVDRMKRMIQDLLDLNSIQGGRLAIDVRPLDARTVVEEVVESFEAEAEERGLSLIGEVEGGLPLIRADRDRVFQALANLVANALKVTTRGGVRVAAHGEADGRCVVFTVRDTGPGIPEDQQARLFEPYWRGQNTYKGTGLGLAITRGVVEAHGGAIRVESTTAGTTFSFEIPVA
jgi:signal transduction histidine kinase